MKAVELGCVESVKRKYNERGAENSIPRCILIFELINMYEKEGRDRGRKYRGLFDGS